MQKLYYSISEVCDLVDEEQHILRYWEKEFNQLKPRKNRGGNRIYSVKDINLINLIKALLRTEKLSLKGAKEQIEQLMEEKTPEEILKEKEIDKLFSNSKGETEKETGKPSVYKEVALSKGEARDLYFLLKEYSEALKVKEKI